MESIRIGDQTERDETEGGRGDEREGERNGLVG